MDVHELEIRVQGRVQGVRFRQMSARIARKLEIRGYVMNRADGSVDILAQGMRARLVELLRWIEESPGFSRIEGVQYHWHVPSRTFSDFTIVKDSSFISDQAKSFLNLGKTLLKKRNHSAPIHISIIPDGNRRWARTHGQEPHFGHYTAASFQHLQEIFSTAQSYGVKYLTLWGFSTENWKRSHVERQALFNLLEQGVKRLRAEVSTRKIRFRHIGRKDRLPASLLYELHLLETESARHGDFNVQLCLDYGGGDELVRAINKLLTSGVGEVNESMLLRALDAPDVPPVDLVIRTSGEQRLSGFMPLQAAYAELYFSPLNFPDFDATELKKAIETFGMRRRRFGGG